MSEARPKIVPKGIRSFSEEDSEFYLSLVPGQRDEHGLPGSLRFWKKQIERMDSLALAVGVLYGPSGSGKSSFLKAGLVPRLASHVMVLFVEATPNGTEKNLIRGLRSSFPHLTAAEDDLPAIIRRLREEHLEPAKRKLVLVFDQFEQWLSGRPDFSNEKLLESLRQCDGDSVQVILSVRDDFWMSISRFMNELRVPLKDGENCNSIDLFEPEHARRVLHAFGYAYGKLPERIEELSSEQNEFLDQVIDGLTRDGRIVCVRLALLADMIKDRKWVFNTLTEIGGVEGVGVRFLEDRFGPHAPPRNQRHRKAAEKVLSALLPSDGDESLIKGGSRSENRLLSVSGYENNPPVFEDLLSLLQHEMRLITKVDSHLATDKDETVSRYQLTHDYLVWSITQWLYRQRCQTSRGRAELSLVERTQLWTAKPESKRLPGLFEFCRIWLLTRKRSWTSGQTRMMRAAAKVYRFYALVFVGVLLLFAIPVGLYLSHLQRQQELAYKRERQQTGYLNDILISSRLLDDGDQRAARERLKRYLDDEELQPLVGFEWRHLWERSAGQSNLFPERTHPIRRIDVDPSGQTLVAATWDGTVGLYDVPQRALRKEFSVPERPKLFGVVLSPNGRFLGAAGVDQIVRVWNVESNALTELSGGHSQTITFLAFSSDGSLLLSAGDDGSVCAWDVTQKQLRRKIDLAGGHLLGLSTSDKGLLAVATERRGIEVLDLEGFQSETTLRHPDSAKRHIPVLSVAFSPDGRWLVAAIGDHDQPGYVSLWDTKTWKHIRDFEGFDSYPYVVRFSPNNKLIGAGFANGKVSVWKMDDATQSSFFQAHNSGITDLRIVDSTNELLTSGRDYTIRHWSLDPNGTVNDETAHRQTRWSRVFDELSPNTLRDLEFTPDGEQLVVALEKSTLLLDTQTLRTLGSEILEDTVNRLAVSPNQPLVAIAPGRSDTNSSLRLWNYKTNQTRKFGAHQGRILSVDFSANGENVISGGEDGYGKIWATDSGDVLFEEKFSNARLVATDANWGDSGREETRLFASSNGEMFLTSPQHQVLATFHGPEMLTEIKFGPGKRMIGVSSMDHSASLYELNEGAIDAMFHLREHNGILNDLAWSPDGRTVATASSDSSVRLWNVATGQRIFKLEPKKTAACLCVAFSLDGRYLAFGTAEGELVVIYAPLE